MTTHKLVEPFDVDDGSLSALSGAQCFALGVEWAMCRNEMAQGKRLFPATVHADNAQRVAAMAHRNGYVATIRGLADSGWVAIRCIRAEKRGQA